MSQSSSCCTCSCAHGRVVVDCPRAEYCNMRAALLPALLFAGVSAYDYFLLELQVGGGHVTRWQCFMQPRQAGASLLSSHTAHRFLVSVAHNLVLGWDVFMHIQVGMDNASRPLAREHRWHVPTELRRRCIQCLGRRRHSARARTVLALSKWTESNILGPRVDKTREDMGARTSIVLRAIP